MRTTLFIAAFALLSACSDVTGVEITSGDSVDQLAKQEDAAGQQTVSIVDIAGSNPAFSILVEAVTRVGLVSTLQADGQFTVFAPTNDAFVDLLAELDAANPGVVIDGLEDIDDATLTTVLLYHVVEGRRFSRSVLQARQLRTLNGDFITVNRGTTSLKDVNGRDANIVTSPEPLFDIPATNGVVHVIDRVLLPSL